MICVDFYFGDLSHEIASYLAMTCGGVIYSAVVLSLGKVLPG